MALPWEYRCVVNDPTVEVSSGVPTMPSPMPRTTWTPTKALLSRVGDKRSLLIVSTLGHGPLRFNNPRRRVGEISQKMLSSTLKVLERDGLVARTVRPTVPRRSDTS